MQTFNLKIKTNKRILALGAELDTTLAYYHQGKVIVSNNLGKTGNDPILLEKKINDFCRNIALQRLPPDYILTDLHPEYNSTKIGAKLAKEWQIPHLKIQHHHAHIFSVVAEHYLLNNNEPNSKLSTFNPSTSSGQAFQLSTFIGIACDGTGYGLDETIWGGEIFKVSPQYCGAGGVINIERIAHLEQQTLLGGQLAVEKPARMLMAILTKFLDEQQLYAIMNKFYNQKVLKLLYSQLKQNFNCQSTTSCGRILDATSALLFGCNERKFKHQAVKILEQNSSEPYDDIEPIIKHRVSVFTILQTTPLFQYLIKNLDKDKNRLAATVHQYIAQGLYQIVQQSTASNQQPVIIFSGGLANNKIFRQYFEKQGALLNKKIPAGDPGISMGQIGYFLLNKNQSKGDTSTCRLQINF